MTLSKRTRLPRLLLALALSASTAWAQTPAPLNSELNSSMMYELLLAEISATNGDASSAYQLMLDTAQKSRSEPLFERAVEIALRARAGESALQAVLAWSRAAPNSQSANRYLLQILIGMNKLADTVEPIKRELAAMAPADRAAAIAQVPRYFLRVDDKKLAAKVVEQALAPELSNGITGPASYATIGTLRLLAGDSESALEAAKKGLALNPKAEEPVQLALMLMDAKLPSAEILVLNHLKASARPEMHMGYIRKLLDLQRYDNAYQQALALNTSVPAYADAWLVRGSLALQKKNLADAQSALSTYVKLRQSADSVEKTGTTNDKGLMQAYFLLADIADQRQQPDEAAHYLALIDSPQEAIRVQTRRASILARQGKLAEARALIRAAPETKPEDARTKTNAEVQLLRDYQQFQLAYDVLREAVAHDPADADLRYDLSMAAEKLGKMDEAEALLRQVIAEKPDYHQAYNALGYSLADRRIRLSEARELVKKALEFAPDDPFIQDSLGWVEFRSGNLPLALQILQGAYQARPDPEIAAHLGEVLWSMGQQDQARTLWNAAVAQSPNNDTLLQTIKRLSQP